VPDGILNKKSKASFMEANSLTDTCDEPVWG
jgi:hypothetical protein